MKATIIIPNINGKGWLKDSIESVYAQTEQDFELIVVDNGSTDESLEQARSYCSRPNFTLIENGCNTGFSHAVNQGIARAKSEFVVLFNNDAFAEPQWLAELLRAAESDEKIFAVQSLMIRHFDRELADDAGDYVTWMGFACKTGDGRRASRYTRQKRIFSACGGAALYRKSILDEIGVFDENFFAYFEDVDLSWRANNAGYKNILCPTAKCYHICGASTGAVRYNAFKSQQSGRNSILLPLKNEPLLMLILPHRSVSVSSVSTPAQSIATVQTLRGSAAAANPSPQSTAAPSVPATAESSEPVESPETEEPPAATPQPDIADSAADAENFDGTYETTDFLGNATTLHGYDAANRHITISDAEFYTWMDVIWANPADYDGWTLTVTGEVDKSSREMDTDEFIPARLIMTCCAADLTPCGFVCKWAQADTLATGTWVTVTGTLYQRQYADHSEPQLQVQSVVSAAPVEGYLYPYY